MTLGRNPFEVPLEEKPPIRPPVTERPPVPERPPEVDVFPPEGVSFTEEGREYRILEDFEFVGTERRLRSKDFLLFSAGSEVGSYLGGTGEFVPIDMRGW